MFVDEWLSYGLDDLAGQFEDRRRHGSPVPRIFTANILGEELSRRRTRDQQRLRAVAPVTFGVKNGNVVYYLSQDAILDAVVLRTTLVIWRSFSELNSSVTFNLSGCKSGKIVASSLFCEVIVKILQETTLNRERKDRKPIRSWIFDNSVAAVAPASSTTNRRGPGQRVFGSLSRLYREFHDTCEQKTQKKQNNVFGPTIGRFGESIREDALSWRFCPGRTRDSSVFVWSQSTGMVPKQARQISSKRKKFCH